MDKLISNLRRGALPMQFHKIYRRWFLLFAVIFSVNSFAAQPVTTANPAIALDHLDLLLTPLTKDDLATEANAWRDLVKAKVSAISRSEIATRNKNEEIAAVKETAKEEGETVKTEAQKEVKQQQKDQYLETLTTLREEQTALLDRFDLVLDEYQEKGGEVEEYRKYATAVSGIKVEVTDTSATWMAIKGWVLSKEGGIKWGLNILKFLVIMGVFYGIARAVGTIIRKTTANSAHLSSLLKTFLNIFIQRGIIFIGLMVALSTLGVQVGALLALVGGGAFIIGFALQDTLGNFAAGVMLLIYRPFDVGDVVEIGGVAGVVDNVSLVSSTIRSFDNKVVLVPNKQVWGQVITNATASDTRRVDLTFGISYSDDIDKAQGIIQSILDSHELILKDPASVVELHTLGESSVDFICRPWARTTDYWRVYWDVIKGVKQAFDAEGISIPFPQRDIHVHQVAAHQIAQKEVQPKLTHKSAPSDLETPELEEAEQN
jgi:small conductance mechanosensitive channel